MSNVFEKTVLPNGLRVLTAPMPQTKSVACFVMVAAGSRYETKDTNGIAHFAEHMFFKGTERRPSARDIAGEIDTIGGEFNAFTGKEYTGYYVKCAAEHRDVALDVLVDMLRHSKFEPEEIDREKGVIIEEMNMYYDTPRDYLEGVYDELLYGDQPLGWDIIGTKETVRGATREKFLGYLDRWYRAHRMVAGIAGNVGDDAVARLEDLLGDVPDGEITQPEPVEWSQDQRAREGLFEAVGPGAHPPRRALVPDRPSGSLRALRARHDPRRRHVVAPVQRGARAPRARLLHLRLQPGLHRRRDAVRPGRRGHRAHRRGDPTVVAEFARIGREPVSDDELSKAKSFSRGRLVLSLEDPRGTIMFGLRSEVLEGAVREPDEVLAGDRRRDGRGRAPRRGGHHPRRPPEPRGDRAVRRAGSLRVRAFALVKPFFRG